MVKGRFLIPYGVAIDDGDSYIHIDTLNADEHRGLNCNLVCVECGERLIARFPKTNPDFREDYKGSIYKKYWYRNGKLIQDWIYQAEGGYDRHDYLVADRDLCSMKALYYGTDIEEIRRVQQVMAEKRLGRLERAVARGTMPEPFQNSIQ